MATLNEKLAGSLTVLKNLSQDGSHRVFKSSEFSRADRERLVRNGFLKEIMNGWLMLSRPDERPGDSTSWYASYWEFCRVYLDDRLDKNWILSAENSVPLLAGNLNVPMQVVVQSPNGQNDAVKLPHGMSIFVYRTALPKFNAVETAGLRTYPAVEAVCAASPTFWRENSNDMIALLGSMRHTSQLLTVLLEGGKVLAAGRIAGAYRALGKPLVADQIVGAMTSAGHQVKDDNPFKAPVQVQLGAGRAVPAVVTRVRLMWAEMRDKVISAFPEPPGKVDDTEAYLAAVTDRYTADAYHSLSIEGYSVSEDLIDRVRSGDWDPKESEVDRKSSDAMAASGYWLAFQEALKSVRKVLEGEEPALVVEADHLKWYAALFRPMVEAGLAKVDRFSGYRQHFIFIRNSGHSPTAWESLPDAMEAFFECLKEEKDPRVLAVLGHFMFTFIHPLPDGNGRSGRFLMNTMLAAGGYPWTIIPVDRRTEYMEALETASVGGDIGPFARFIADCVRLEPPPPRRMRPGEVQEEAQPAALPPARGM